MYKNKIDSEKRFNVFVQEIIEKKEILLFRLPDSSNMIFSCESRGYSYEDGASLQVIPVWSTTYLPYAKFYGEGLILDKIGIEEFYYRTLPFVISHEGVLGINWDQQGIGREILPMVILEELVLRKSEWSLHPGEVSFYCRAAD